MKLIEHDDNHSCTTLILNPSYNFEWVPLDCNRVFKNVHFMCEFELETSNTIDHSHMKPSRPHCSLLFTYFNSVCIRLVHESSVITHTPEKHDQGNSLYQMVIL